MEVERKRNDYRKGEKGGGTKEKGGRRDRKREKRKNADLYKSISQALTLKKSLRRAST